MVLVDFWPLGGGGGSHTNGREKGEYRRSAGLDLPPSLVAAPPSVRAIALLPLDGGAGDAAPVSILGGNREHAALPAGLVAPASLLPAPTTGVTVALLPLGGGAGAAALMGLSRVRRDW